MKYDNNQERLMDRRGVEALEEIDMAAQASGVTLIIPIRLKRMIKVYNDNKEEEASESEYETDSEED